MIPTPFSQENEVDLESLKSVVQYATDSHANALVYPGVASEDIQLSAQERLQCLTVVTETAAGQTPIIAGVNSNEPETMVEMAALMRQHGADGIMAMAVPSMVEKGYKYWFQAISDATDGLPIILQNLFSPRGADLSADQMIELAKDVEAIRYVKEEGIPSGPKVSAVFKNAGDYLDGIIGGGGARYVFEELERGAIATMPAIELLELHVALLESYLAGERDKTLRLYQQSLAILLMQAPYRMRLTKLILKHRGIIKTDVVRESLPELDEYSKKLILEMYQQLDLTNVSSGIADNCMALNHA